MKKGELREKILANCPAEFAGELWGHLNEIESLLNDALGEFGDLDSDGEAAKSKIEDVAHGLY